MEPLLHFVENGDVSSKSLSVEENIPDNVCNSLLSESASSIYIFFEAEIVFPFFLIYKSQSFIALLCFKFY
jgi:hypothetical protein